MTACSVLSRDAGEPLIGTAPEAVSWIALEQPGPWGPSALTDSHLDPDLGTHLDKAAKEVGARVSLIRRPGQHADSADAVSRRIFIAHTRPGRSWLLGGWITDPAVLETLSWTALTDGRRDGVADSIPGLSVESDPQLLVCTNGRRDVCCALRGRALVHAIRDRRLGRIWEATHLSGHRFAPTAVVLPTGCAYGRLDPDAAVALLDAASAGHFIHGHYRGRSTYERPAQVAEARLRDELPNSDLDDLDVTSLTRIDLAEVTTWRAILAHRDGRAWSVDVREAERPGVRRPESCDADPLPLSPLVAGTPLPLR